MIKAVEGLHKIGFNAFVYKDFESFKVKINEF